jgi:hypothetical protein
MTTRQKEELIELEKRASNKTHSGKTTKEQR